NPFQTHGAQLSGLRIHQKNAARGIRNGLVAELTLQLLQLGDAADRRIGSLAESVEIDHAIGYLRDMTCTRREVADNHRRVEGWRGASWLNKRRNRRSDRQRGAGRQTEDRTELPLFDQSGNQAGCVAEKLLSGAERKLPDAVATNIPTAVI